MLNTKISWTNHTWNPWTGGAPVSEGCRYCYAKRQAESMAGTPAFPNGFGFTPKLHKMNVPRTVKKPGMFFICSMSDFFLDQAGDGMRDQVLEVIRACPRHVFQILTKRHAGMLAYWQRRDVPANVMLGVTVENPQYYKRITALRNVECGLRFVSAEPMLSAMPDLPLEGIGWVIVAGESGPHLKDPAIRDARGMAVPLGDRGGHWGCRQDRQHWVTEIRALCRAAGVPFFFKQWGGPRHDSAGHLLDGEVVQEFPALPFPAPAPTLF